MTYAYKTMLRVSTSTRLFGATAERVHRSGDVGVTSIAKTTTGNEHEHVMTQYEMIEIMPYIVGVTVHHNLSYVVWSPPPRLTSSSSSGSPEESHCALT